ncbi:MAG: hypothetical protein ACLQNE_28810 [Thermoguttaceae bacterium]
MQRRLFLCFWCLAVASAVSAWADSIPQDRIDALARLLLEQPGGVGRPIADRAAWEAIARAKPFARVVTRGEAILKEPIAELPDALYLDFSKTGNRTRCEAVLGKRHGRLPSLVLAECIENRGRFLPAIEETIRAIAAEKTWVMPAHDAGLRNFRGTTIEIDLGAATMGREMATARWWLGDRLSAETRDLVRDELTRRLFQFNSFGHSVPRVAGQLQQTGRAAAARVVRSQFTEKADTLVLDIRSAYPVKSLKKLTRTFVFSREGSGSLTVCDEVEFSTPEEFGTALITLSPWKSLAGNQLLVGEGKESVRVTIATDGPAHKLRPEQIHENMPHNLVPTRLGIDLERPVAKARITLTIRPAESSLECGGLPPLSFRFARE